MTVVSFNMAYRSFQGGSGRLDTRLDTPPSINRRHPNSCLAPRHHPSDPRRATAAPSDGGEAASALTSAARLARSAGCARLRLSLIPNSQDPPASPSPDEARPSVGNPPCDFDLTQQVVATASPEIRYWNIARQRYCRRLARCWRALRRSADRVGNAARHTRAECRTLDARR